MKSTDSLLFHLTVFTFIWKPNQGDVCPRNWVEFRSMCYQLQQTSTDYEKARLKCAAANGQLASIRTDKMAYDVKSALSTNGNMSSIWSRYILRKNGSDVEVIADGQLVNFCEGCTSVFDEFNASTSDRSCVVISGITTASANWILSECKSSNEYVCEKLMLIDNRYAVTPVDIAAIVCAIFLTVGFVFIMALDILRHPATFNPEESVPIQA